MTMPQPSPPNPQSPAYQPTDYPPPPTAPGAEPPPPMAPGAGPPPPVNSPGPKPVGRPAVTIIAGVLMGGLALFFFGGAALEFAELLPSAESYDSYTNIRIAFLVLMGLVSLLAAILAIVNGDFGRVFAASVAGAAMWEAASWWQSILLTLLDNNTGSMPEEFWLRALPPVLGGFTGILALIVLSIPKISDWSASKRLPKS